MSLVTRALVQLPLNALSLSSFVHVCVSHTHLYILASLQYSKSRKIIFDT